MRRLLGNGLIAREFYGHVWQGIYVCLWHSDTMVKQAKLSQEIVALVVPDLDSHFEWYKLGLIVLRKHWNELDFFRVNKFMYLVRLMLEDCFKKIQAGGFKKSVFSLFNSAVVATTILNDDILERGFILHIIHIYPELAIVPEYPSVTEMFFGIKPLLDLLTFTEIKVIRDNIFDRLLDIWLPFCTLRLTSRAQEYIKDKLMNFASADQVPVPNRKKLYDILEAFGDVSEPQAGDKPLIDVKVPGVSKSHSNSVVGQEVSQGQTAASSSNGRGIVQSAGQVAKAKKLKVNEAVKERKQAAAHEKENGSEMVPEAVVISSSVDLLKKPSKKAAAKETRAVQGAVSSAGSGQGVDVLQRIKNGEPLEQIYEQLGVTEEEIADPEELDMSTMTYEQLRQKLPAYMFMTGKRQAKYFKKIMTEYTNNLKQQPSKQKTQRVKFNQGAPVSRVKVFNKLHKVAPPGTKVQSKNACPKILKSTVAVDSPAQ